MAWFAVYFALDGHLYSQGSVVADPLPPGLAAKDIGAPPAPGAVWNAQTLAFGDAPPEPKIDTPAGFLARFTPDELVAARGSTDSRVQYLLFRLSIAQDIDRARDDVVDGVDLLEALGIIAAGRAAEVLA